MTQKRFLTFILTMVCISNLMGQPCLPGWKYYKKITLTNPNGALSDFQVLLSGIDTKALIESGKMAVDGRDLRIVNVGGTSLPYWIENGTLNSINTRIWVKTDILAANPAITDLYLFYGNSNAFAFSNGNSTFEFFDDFEGSVSEKWNSCDLSKITFSNGQAILNTNTDSEKAIISTNSSFVTPFVSGLKVISFNGAGTNKTAFLGQHNGSKNGYALCLRPSSGNTLDIRPLSNDADCFTDQTPNATSSYTDGNTLWQLRWISDNNQRGTAEGSVPVNDITSSYNNHSLPGSCYASIGAFKGAGTLVAEWFFIRKYAPNDNITFTITSEVTLPATGNVIISNNSPLCEGSTLQLSADDIPGATFTWSKNGTPITSGRTYTKSNVVPSDAGDYVLTITPSAPNPCPSYTVTEAVAINPSTVAGTITNAPAAVCSGSNSGNLNLTGYTGAIKRWEYSHTFGDPWYATANTSSTQNFSNITQSTSFRAIVQSGNCAEKTTPAVNIIVDPPAVSGAITGAKPVCRGESITLTLSGHTGTVSRWFSSTDSLNWTAVVTTQTTVNYSNLTATTWYKTEVSSGSCNSATTVPVKVVVSEPSLGGTFSGTTLCRGSSHTLNLTGQTGNVIQWEYSLTGGQPWTTITSTNQNLLCENLQQTTWYRAVVQNGACTVITSEIDTIIVDQPANPGYVSGSDTVCTGANSGILKLTGYTGKIANWQQSSDGNSWSDLPDKTISLTYSNLSSGTYYRVLVNSVYGACPAQASQSANIVVSSSTVGGTITGAGNLCAVANKGRLELTGQTGKVIRWERSPSGKAPWFVIANTTDSLPYHDLPETTWYRAIVKSGACLAKPSDSAALVVSQPSEAGVISGITSACANNNEGSLILFGIKGDVTKWQKSTDNLNWSAAAFKTPVELAYKNLVTTTHYRAIVRNGICPTDTTQSATITIYPLPVPDFKADTADLGKITHFTNLASIPSGKIISQSWDFGDGYSSSAKNPLHTFAGAGTWEVKLNATSDKGCTDSVKRNVLVYELPRPSFSFGNVCLGDTVKFINTSTITSGNLNYRWYFGDGKSSEEKNPWHVYTSSGNFYTKLVVISDNGTRDSVTREVNIHYRSAPDFSFSNVCRNVSVIFSNKTTIAKGSLTYRWKMGDETLMEALNPEHTYKLDGNYNITLISTTDKGCVDSVTRAISVYPLPSAQFGGKNVPYNDILNFNDSSTISQGSIAEWKWDFGDAQTSAEQHPGHLYASPNVYLVMLKVKSNYGCESSISKNIEIYALPNASFSFSDVCDRDTVFFVNNSTVPAGTLSYFWDFDDLQTSVSKNPAHRYANPGAYNVQLIVTSDKGGKDTLTRLVTVHPRPAPDFESAGACEGFPAYLTNRSLVATGRLVSYAWDFGDGTNSIQENPVKQFLNPDVYYVTLKAISDKGCIASVTRPVEMFYAPVANFDAQHVCFGSSVKFSNNSSVKKGTMQYIWKFGDAATSIITHPEHFYSQPDTFSIRLTVVTDHNCKDSILKKIIVRDAPRVDAGKDTSVIKGFAVKLTASGGIIYDWSPAESLDNPLIAAPVARPRETTTYKVKVRNEHNCESSDSVTVKVTDEQRIIPANIITPDGDGINDTWRITNIDFYEDATIRIFNRWGEQVYYKKNYLQDWDGKNTNGDTLPDGTYYYVITFPDSDKNYKGAITILRNK